MDNTRQIAHYNTFSLWVMKGVSFSPSLSPSLSRKNGFGRHKHVSGCWQSHTPIKIQIDAHNLPSALRQQQKQWRDEDENLLSAYGEVHARVVGLSATGEQKEGWNGFADTDIRLEDWAKVSSLAEEHCSWCLLMHCLLASFMSFRSCRWWVGRKMDAVFGNFAAEEEGRGVTPLPPPVCSPAELKCSMMTDPFPLFAARGMNTGQRDQGKHTYGCVRWFLVLMNTWKRAHNYRTNDCRTFMTKPQQLNARLSNSNHKHRSKTNMRTRLLV